MKIIFTLICFCGVFYASAQRCVVVDYPGQQTTFRSQGQSPFSTKDGRDTLPNEVLVIPV